ncbi:MAG: glycoside hydrolase family 3 N-terminal domain-containing protein, partial [Gemmatimonadales bacterium]
MNPARLVLPALRWREDGGFAHEDGTIGEALDLGVGGFIVFGGTVASVAELTGELEKRAGRPLLLASDLERGAGQQIRGLAEIPPPRALATLGDPRIAYDAGLLTGSQAREVGLNWVLAPDADLDCEPANPIVQTRAFGDDPEVVARLVDNWVRGCQASGALACVKHYPGHGRTTVDSHAELPTVDAPASALSSEDRVPFNAGIRAG